MWNRTSTVKSDLMFFIAKEKVNRASKGKNCQKDWLHIQH